MSTKFKKRVMVDAAEKLPEIESWAPEGWKFHRAAYSTTENHGDGVRIWFTKKPVDPPEPVLKDGAVDQIQHLYKRTFKEARYVQGKDGLELVFEDESTEFLSRQFADLFFDYRPTRRPTLRLLTRDQLKGLSQQIMDATARGTEYSGDDVVVDVLLSQAECRELFSLGENVIIEGVRGHWQGEPVPGRGICTGFSLRCVAAV